MNRGEFRTAIKNRLAIPSAGDGLITDTIVNDAINQALTVLTMSRDWPWLVISTQIAFPADIATAELPSDMLRAKELVINNATVPYVELNQWLEAPNQGYPYIWTITGNQARIAPTPGALVLGTLWYYRTDPALTVDAQEPLLPDVFSEWIIAYASYLCAMRRQDEGTAQVYLAQANDIQNRMRDDTRSKTGRKIQSSRRWNYVSWR